MIDIVNAYNYTLDDVQSTVFSQPPVYIKDKHIKQVKTGKQLVEVGANMGNCLTRINKLRYYTYEMCRGNWYVYHTMRNGEQALTTIDSNYSIIETEGPWSSGKAVTNRACKYSDSVFVPYKRITSDRTKCNDMLVKEIKSRCEWERFEFIGIRENKPYRAIKSVLCEIVSNIATLIVADPDQENNYRHKIITAYNVSPNMYISTDTFDVNYDYCFKKYIILANCIRCVDVNDDPIVSFDVCGIKYDYDRQ